MHFCIISKMYSYPKFCGVDTENSMSVSIFNEFQKTNWWQFNEFIGQNRDAYGNGKGNEDQPDAIWRNY